MNKVFLLGNLTRDPELHYTASGTALCTFGVATNREWSPADSDDVREETEFHNVVAWGKLAELCGQLLFKGRKVFIEGRLNTRSWDDTDAGTKVYRTEVVCKEMVALDVPRSVREARAKENLPVDNATAVDKSQVAAEKDENEAGESGGQPQVEESDNG
ncbi:single-stranded DNA-binding protein [Patescibacteria group bacterium]|nr:single-stranded DNA-binding protein [Patescibacteria group bacterium]